LELVISHNSGGSVAAVEAIVVLTDVALAEVGRG
jgi:hypothetical protein